MTTTNITAEMFANYADVASYEAFLGEQSTTNLKIEYRRVFGRYPTKDQSANDEMIVRLRSAFIQATTPEMPAEKATKEPTKTVDQLLAELATTTDKAAKKRIRAALRRQGHFQSKVAKNAKIDADVASDDE